MRNMGGCKSIVEIVEKEWSEVGRIGRERMEQLLLLLFQRTHAPGNGNCSTQITPCLFVITSLSASDTLRVHRIRVRVRVRHGYVGIYVIDTEDGVKPGDRDSLIGLCLDRDM